MTRTRLPSACPPLPTRRQVLASLGAAALPAWAAAPAKVTMAPLPLRERMLANGLQVVAIPDRATATAAVQVWYHVGSKDDPPGRSGFAHLFEHMMFKGTRHMAPEMFDRLTEDVGGINNAFTADDCTVYQSEVPSNHLERLLWAEAERMASLRVEQAGFESERKVVQEEYRLRVLADPYGRFFNDLVAHAYAVHPYKRPGIGNIDDLNAATLDDVRRFHANFYRPDNAVLIVGGDFDPRQLDAWIDLYFAPIPRPGSAIPRVDVVEPRRLASRRDTLQAPNVPLPALALLWQGPPAAHADAPALKVASALLAGGESSRLNQALVYRAQSAQQAGFDAQLNADAGMLAAYAIAAAGQPLGRIEQQLRQEIGRLARGPIGAAELDKVRTQLLTATLVGRQTPAGQADAVGWALVLNGDARYADGELARLQAVSAADVQRVLRRYVLDGHAVSVSYTQAGAA